MYFIPNCIYDARIGKLFNDPCTIIVYLALYAHCITAVLLPVHSAVSLEQEVHTVQYYSIIKQHCLVIITECSIYKFYTH